MKREQMKKRFLQNTILARYEVLFYLHPAINTCRRILITGQRLETPEKVSQLLGHRLPAGKLYSFY